MRWSSGGESEDIEDRCDDGGGGGFQFGGMHIGIGGAIILLILSFIFKTNLFTLLSGGAGDSGPAAVRQPDKARDVAEQRLVNLVSFAWMTRKKPGRNCCPIGPPLASPTIFPPSIAPMLELFAAARSKAKHATL